MNIRKITADEYATRQTRLTRASAMEAAIALGVSRRTIYRWVDEGRLPWPIRFDETDPPRPRPRGPQRNPMARRYTHGRHTFRARGE